MAETELVGKSGPPEVQHYGIGTPTREVPQSPSESAGNKQELLIKNDQ